MKETRPMKYRVYCTRTAVFEVEEATSRSDAIADMIAGHGEPITEGESIQADPICPDCDSALTNRTTRETGKDTQGRAVEEPSYCDQCDREIYTPEEEARLSNFDDAPY